MTTRSQRSSKERTARSRAVKRLADRDLMQGSLVEMERTCGKSGCRCQRGEKHRSLYLSINKDGRRSLIYIPRQLESTARQWVNNARELNELLRVISQCCLDRLLDKKQQAMSEKPKARKTEGEGSAP